MRNTGFALLCAFATLTSACGDLLSLHPLYDKSDTLVDPALEGRWEDDDDVLLVERDGNGYRATLQSKRDASESQKYEVRLVNIDGVRFADLLWEDSIGHMFVRTRVSNSELRLSFFDSEWLRKRITHEESEVDGGRTRAVVTTRTPQLKRMVAKYAREPKAYDEHDVVYRRVR